MLILLGCNDRKDVLNIGNTKYKLMFSVYFNLYNNAVPSDSGFDFSTMRAKHNLKRGTLGYDAGVVIPSFIDSYVGSAPDMGAFEAGEKPLEYGVKAYIESKDKKQ